MEINGESFKVKYDDTASVVAFEGSCRLGGPQDYQPIADLLEKTLAAEGKAVTLDFRRLEFLNSSGINVIYKYAVAARKRDGLRIVAVGSNLVPWQSKSLPNLKRFHNGVELVFDA